MKFSIRFLLFLTLIAGISFWIATLPPTKLGYVRGIAVTESGTDKSRFVFTDQASRQTVANLINLLENGGKIDFYDSEPTISDPGVYVTLKKADEGFLFHFGNHGWTTSWIPANREEAIDYLWACHSDNDQSHNQWPYLEQGMSFTIVGTLPDPDRINVDPKSRFAVHIRQRGKPNN